MTSTAQGARNASSDRVLGILALIASALAGCGGRVDIAQQSHPLDDDRTEAPEATHPSLLCCPPWAGDTAIALWPQRLPTAIPPSTVSCSLSADFTGESTRPVEFVSFDQSIRNVATPGGEETLTAVEGGYSFRVSADGESAEFTLTQDFLESEERRLLEAELGGQEFVYEVGGMLCPTPTSAESLPWFALPTNCSYVKEDSDVGCHVHFWCDDDLEVVLAYEPERVAAGMVEPHSTISCLHNQCGGELCPGDPFEPGAWLGSATSGEPGEPGFCPLLPIAGALQECAFPADYRAALAQAAPR